MKTTIGKEVEGRLKGVKSQFVHDAYIPGSGCGHIYFNPDYIQVNGYTLIQRLMSIKLVTVCVTLDMLKAVPNEVLSGCHIVVSLTISQDLRDYLKRGDEIRLDYRDKENSSFTWGTGTEAQADDYLNDLYLDDKGHPLAPPARRE